ncbi:MAG TPA: hypothetical protein PKC55_13050 [Dysgonomonas sp.]|uniref:hypothetical protein n=1 Tax=unclassified Dysgonomonas TaxID=2630389 RepID=UPI0024BC00F1|nr:MULTISPECIES: hypothetical protein [unclassified Dysgonomonas]HML65753.1 hypothetical protein [Dysgonomonas sp.]
MKTKGVVILFLLFSVLEMSSQEGQTKRYLCDQFMDGKIIYKDNKKISKGFFNYDTVSEKLLFLSEKKIMELSDVSDIEYVEFNKRIFEHIKGNVFYEKIKVKDLFFYIRRSSNIIQEGTSGAFGTKSNTTAIMSIGSILAEDKKYNLNSSGYSVYPNDSYYLKLESKFKRFNSINSLAKLFKDQESTIKEQLKELNLDFKNIEDVKKAVEYCSQFVE